MRRYRVRTIDSVIVGAGHAGLAMSRCLSERSIEHVIFERGEVANSWKKERWESLRLLTPNWQSRLPGYRYEGDDPDGYSTMPELIGFLERYASVVSAPLRIRTTVTAVSRADGGYVVKTDQGEWRCRTIVIATGACNIAAVPSWANAVPSTVQTLTPLQYRGPQQIEPGGVMVVGASATGIQLAVELHRSGCPVTLCVGEHIRAPRTYRGKDIQWWMDVTGLFDQRYDQVDDIARARRLPSMQLVGTPERLTLDLNALRTHGIKPVGRLAGIRDGTAQFSGSLRNQCALADLKMGRLLDTFDRWARDHGLESQLESPMRLPPTAVEQSPRLELNLASGEIKTIVWATGYGPDYSWLQIPVLDRKGQIRHNGGVAEAPGMYVLGLQFLRRRKSAFIDGATDDANDLSEHLLHYLKSGRPILNPTPRSDKRGGLPVFAEERNAQ
jgi:putative flavoprotein involved in K+ transport